MFIMEQMKPFSFLLNSNLFFLAKNFIFIVRGGGNKKELFFGIFLDLLNPSQRAKPYLPILCVE